MIRKENVNSRDLELLNVALDHALTPQEQIEFNKRLSECPYLTTLYQQQRHLKSTIGQLPCRKVPHNFTLTRAEARKAKRAGFLQPMFGWASAISALLVAVIFGSEFIFRNVSLTAPMPADSPQVFSLEQGTESAIAPEEATSMLAAAPEPVYLLNWGYGATGLGGIGGKCGGGDAAASNGVSVNIYISPDVYISDDLALEGAGAGAGAGGITEDIPMDMIAGAIPEEEIAEREVPEQETIPEESLMATPLPMKREAPRIYGIDSEKVGSVLKMTPDSSETQAEQPSEAQARTAKEDATGSIVSTQIRFALLAAALVFGLIWLVLKIKH